MSPKVSTARQRLPHESVALFYNGKKSVAYVVERFVSRLGKLRRGSSILLSSDGMSRLSIE
jgi:hypothetical protein